MARANRHYIPGYAWHITHRCHKKEFLLKFAKDRQGWLDWLFEAKKRYGIGILNYMVTCNHIHLLLHDSDGGEIIPKSIQLAAGRTAQEYNQRKRRKGAFWEDRYHATAVQTDHHLVQCIVYMDLNMVRAGAVTHPSKWPHSGYGEIQEAPHRYRLIDRKALMHLLGMSDSDQLSRYHRTWIEEALKTRENGRQRRWSESIAVGSLSFIQKIKGELGAKGFGRKIIPSAGGHELREPHISYQDHFGGEKVHLSDENSLLWSVYDDMPI
jgi:REP element-mobilizing transposase RayT